MKRIGLKAVIMVFTFLFTGVTWSQDMESYFKKAAGAFKTQDYQTAIPEFKKALELAKKTDNPAAAQLIQMNIGISYFRMNQNEKAIQELEAAKALNKNPNPKLDMAINRTLASAYQKLHHYALHAEIIEGLLKRHKDLEDAAKADMLADLGDSYRHNEIHNKAINCYSESLKLFEKLDQLKRQAPVLTAMALSKGKIAGFQDAIEDLEAALTISEKLNNPQNLAEIYSNMGIVYWDRGDYPKALQLIQKAIDLEKDNNLNENLGADRNNEGLIYKSAGNLDKAVNGFETAIKIARNIKNKKDEAIALSNLALVKRLQGDYGTAMKYYQNALKLYESERFIEGTASCYLGIGKLYQIDKQDYATAYKYFQKARDLYQKLNNLAYEAEAWNEIGGVLKKGIDPLRTTRDLIFEDQEPVFIEMSPVKAAKASVDAYKKALELSEKTGKKEQIWAALQGIGYALRANGELEEAFDYYKKAVDTVISIRGSKNDSKLMANYLRDKEYLFTQIIDLSAALYAKTNDKLYLRRQMEYQEIYKNEVIKNAMNTANLDYAEPQKAELNNKIKEAIAKKEKLEELSSDQKGQLSDAPASTDETAKKDLSGKLDDLTAENKEVAYRIQTLDKDIEKLLDEWKKKYPSDVGMFDSAAQVDLDEIQENLKKDQALVQYFPLPDKLNILCVTPDVIKTADVKITYDRLYGIIRDQFTDVHIEKFGHMNLENMSDEESEQATNEILYELYKILLKPIENEIKVAESLIIVPSKYLSYLPFAALVTKFEAGKPHYLLKDKTISYIRLSFFNQVYSKKTKSLNFENSKLIGVGNPNHQYLKAGLGDLPGAEAEIKNAITVAKGKKLPVAEAIFQKNATESKWREMVMARPYNIFYFATHGVPYAEIIYDREATIKPYIEKLNLRITKTSNETKKEKYENTKRALNAFIHFIDKTFPSPTPLNGFLYMSYTGKEDQDGVLTLKEIMEMPESVFKEANLAILSACNTAVTYSPKVDNETRAKTQSENANKELLASGWTPGVDQICLTDTFMKRNFKSVLGTLWFADDEATGFIIAKFFENLSYKRPAEALRQAQLAYLENPPMGPDYTKVPKHPFFWAVSAVFGQ